LIRRGYKVTLITDAVKAVNKEGETKSLKEMKDACTVFTTTEVIITG
jgi:nicotinamidase-related amidase